MTLGVGPHDRGGPQRGRARHGLSRRTKLPGWVHYSDRGSLYASGDYTDLLKEKWRGIPRVPGEGRQPTAVGYRPRGECEMVRRTPLRGGSRYTLCVLPGIGMIYPSDGGAGIAAGAHGLNEVPAGG